MTTEVVNVEKPKAKRAQQFRNVCYTAWKVPIMGGQNQVYNIYGEEICPKTQKLHYQGYVEFNRPLTLNTVKKSLGDSTAHIEKREGTQQEAIDYCKKDNKFTEWGTPKDQGSRGDLAGTTKDIIEGKTTVEQIIETNPFFYHEYGRTLEKAEDIKLRRLKRTWTTKGVWIYGPTGTGKSHYVYEKDPDAYTWVDDKGWQDGYVGQKTIIIDDFRGDIPYNILLKMIDKYDFKISRRGRSPMPLLAETIYITSSMHPKDVYHNLAAKDKLEQLLRRIQIIKMDTAYDDYRLDYRSGQMGNTTAEGRPSGLLEKNSIVPVKINPKVHEDFDDDDPLVLNFGDF